MPDAPADLFDVKAFIEGEFQNIGGLRNACARTGMPVPTVMQIYKWLDRSHIPGNWLIFLLAAREIETDRPRSVRKYVGGGVA